MRVLGSAYERQGLHRSIQQGAKQTMETVLSLAVLFFCHVFRFFTSVVFATIDATQIHVDNAGVKDIQAVRDRIWHAYFHVLQGETKGLVRAKVFEICEQDDCMQVGQLLSALGVDCHKVDHGGCQVPG